MASIITTKDLSVKDTSKLKTGNTRRSYNMAVHQGDCPPGQHKVGGKCVPRKGNPGIAPVGGGAVKSPIRPRRPGGSPAGIKKY